MFRLISTSLLLTACWNCATARAADGLCGGCKPAGCGSSVRWVCCPKWEKETIEKSGFEVECEHICVPRVRLPWQDCCTPRCARVIAVNRLKKVTQECGERCVLTWEAKPVCVHCRKPVQALAPACQCGPCH
jgi:hypothetical protein